MSFCDLNDPKAIAGNVERAQKRKSDRRNLKVAWAMWCGHPPIRESKLVVA